MDEDFAICLSGLILCFNRADPFKTGGYWILNMYC